MNEIVQDCGLIKARDLPTVEMLRASKLGQQRLQMGCIFSPSSSGTAVERLPDLERTSRADLARNLMESENSRFPRKSEEVQQPPRLRLEVVDQRLIIDLQEVRGRKCSPPVRRKLLASAAKAGKLRLAIGECLRL
jgi:hypothetical protein